MSVQKFSVTVPGTSANLGPGFDLVGAATEICNKLEIEITRHENRNTVEFTNTIEGCQKPEGFQDLTELGFREMICFLRGEKGVHGNLEPTHLADLGSLEEAASRIENCEVAVKGSSDIPVGGGLGSSSAAYAVGVMVGILAALPASYEMKWPQQHWQTFLFEACSKYDGHPDNAAACIFGGIRWAVSDTDVRVVTADPKLKAILVIPSEVTNTNESRAGLPTTFGRGDVVTHANAIFLLIEGLRTGSLGDILRAFDMDVLHVPQRKPLNKTLLRLIEVLPDSAPVTLSGSGSTCLIIISREAEEEVKKVLQDTFVGQDVRIVPSELGAGGLELTVN